MTARIYRLAGSADYSFALSRPFLPSLWIVSRFCVPFFSQVHRERSSHQWKLFSIEDRGNHPSGHLVGRIRCILTWKELIGNLSCVIRKRFWGVWVLMSFLWGKWRSYCKYSEWKKVKEGFLLVFRMVKKGMIRSIERSPFG